MASERSEIKLNTVQEIGIKLDDNLEALSMEAHRSEGAARALSGATQVFDRLSQLVDKETDENKYDLTTASHIKRFIVMARQTFAQQASQSEQAKFVQLGKVQAMQQAVKTVKQFKDDIEAKLRREQELIEKAASGELPQENAPRPVGTRPNATLKEIRNAKAAVQAAIAPEAIASIQPEAPAEDVKPVSEVVAEVIAETAIEETEETTTEEATASESSATPVAQKTRRKKSS